MNGMDDVVAGAPAVDASRDFSVVETSIDELRAALDAGRITAVELVARFLNRIAAFDRRGPRLNSVPVLNPDMFDEALASDRRRAIGTVLGPLDGIPYTAKDSFKVRGMTAAAGSPAFSGLVATDDAFTIARLRTSGAVLIGRTNMPPMANGGMQRGLYGRAESPYNANYLTSAFASGSSNGSGTATAASFASFGLGEETWSSGRAPASCNALVAYTPSRGVISVRGNWPLVPTMDVVVPHARSMADLLEILDVVVADDDDTRGDFWRVQPWVEVPATSSVRPASYLDLRDEVALVGRRLGVPRMYINADAGASAPIHTRASVIALWQSARKALESLGAEVVEVDFPVVTNYERSHPPGSSMVERGLVPDGFAESELWDLCMWSFDDFLRANGDPALPSLAAVDGPLIFPTPDGALADRYVDEFDIAEYVVRAREGLRALDRIPHLAAGLRGLETARRVDFEEWMQDLGLDAVVFPALADIAPADADVNVDSADLAWRNGTWVANGNLVPRHLGIPTVTVPMGTMDDIGMPVGLTFAGSAYDDSNLLRYAFAFEAAGKRRSVPPRVPEIAAGAQATLRAGSPKASEAQPGLVVSVVVESAGTETTVRVDARSSEPLLEARIYVDGQAAAVRRSEAGCQATVRRPTTDFTLVHSQWTRPYGSIVSVIALTASGVVVGGYGIAGESEDPGRCSEGSN